MRADRAGGRSSGVLRRLVRFFLWTVGAAVGLTTVYTLLLIPLTPSPAALLRARDERPSVILSADGRTLATYDDAIRVHVPLAQVSPHVLDALVSTEDHRFYTHRGIDPIRLLGSIAYTLAGRAQGGSTITMQLARNLYPDRIGRSNLFTRKLKEGIVALRIESWMTKDEILELYLNTVPFLYRIQGIEMAAQTYFDKPASDLTPAESAVLVGMLKGTDLYNPVRNPDRALARRNVVLGRMLALGRIDSTAWREATAQALGTRFRRPGRSTEPAPHFAEAVRSALGQWAEARGIDLKTEGLVVHSTLDATLQRFAVEAVQRQGDALQSVADVEWSRRENPLHSSRPQDYAVLAGKRTPFAWYWSSRTNTVDAFIRESGPYRELLAAGTTAEEALASLRADEEFMKRLRAAKRRLETAFVAIDPRTGEVKAWVGSRDAAVGPYDHVRRARRQPGSTFKPFVYAAALMDGIRPGDVYIDREVEVDLGRGRTWRPANASGISGRAVTVREALESSKNTITVQIASQVGARRIAEVARSMGITESELRAVPSLALGTSEVTLLEMVSAYATIADEGRYRRPLLIRRIEDADGRVLDEFSSDLHQALPEETAHLLADMMRGVIDSGTGQRIRSVFGIHADVAGKTGTTQDNADGWFLLMHPHLVGGSWVGFDDRRVTFRSDYWGQGAHNALHVVGDFYRQALRTGTLDASPLLAPYPEPDFDWTEPRLNRGWLHQLIIRAAEGISRPFKPHRPERPARSSDAPERRVQSEADRALRDAAREFDRVLDEVEDGLDRDLRREIERLRRDLDRHFRESGSSPERRNREAERQSDRLDRLLEQVLRDAARGE